MTDKVIIVTGGSRGIGAAIAKRLAAAGADVAVQVPTASAVVDAGHPKLAEARDTVPPEAVPGWIW